MKWDQSIRRIVYEKIKKEFGHCSTWKSRTNPTGDKDDFDFILHDISIALEILTGEKFEETAIKAQIAWGLQKKQSECSSIGMVSNFILNRAIALEVGIISPADLPNFALFERI